MLWAALLLGFVGKAFRSPVPVGQYDSEGCGYDVMAPRMEAFPLVPPTLISPKQSLGIFRKQSPLVTRNFTLSQVPTGWRVDVVTPFYLLLATLVYSQFPCGSGFLVTLTLIFLEGVVGRLNMNMSLLRGVRGSRGSPRAFLQLRYGTMEGLVIAVN